MRQLAEQNIMRITELSHDKMG